MFTRNFVGYAPYANSLRGNTDEGTPSENCPPEESPPPGPSSDPESTNRTKIDNSNKWLQTQNGVD